jgi:hypothetical protein
MTVHLSARPHRSSVLPGFRTISESQDFNIFQDIIYAGNNIISAEIRQIPRAEIGRFLARKYEDSSPGNTKIPHGNAVDPLLEMFNKPTLPVPEFWRSPTCSFWFRSITCGPDPAALFWTKKFLRLTPSSYLILNIRQSFEF